MKKRLSILLTLVMILTVCVPVFAAETYKVIINDATTGHTYEAYQIFEGDVSEDGKTLSNIKWGSGVNSAAFTGTAEENAALLKGQDSDSVEAKAFAAKAGQNLTTVAGTSTQKSGYYEITGLAPGYYLVKDRADTITGHDAYTRFILQVVGNVEVNPKRDFPAVEKKVQDDDVDGWNDSADYDIGDSVPYKLTGTLPLNLVDYQNYYYQFTDELTAGLTYNDDAKVYIVNGEAKTDVTDQVGVVYHGSTLTVASSDIKNLAGVTVTAESKVVVEYTATLNDQAAIGMAGNPNTVNLTYSNDPNYTGGYAPVPGEPDGPKPGDPSYPGPENPNYPDPKPLDPKDPKPPIGETPKDKVTVFTYKLVVNKVDENKDALEGAGFTLYKIVDEAETKVGEQLATGSIFTWKGLDAGQYVLRETTTPDGYNTVDDIKFTITATHELESDDPQLTSLVTNNDAVTGDIKTGQVTTTVINSTGTLLPETGGMGTKLFYLIGGAMTILAAAALIKKRNSIETNE